MIGVFAWAFPQFSPNLATLESVNLIVDFTIIYEALCCALFHDAQVFGQSIASLRICTEPVACNNGAGGYKERPSKPKRTLFLRKVKLKNRKVKLKNELSELVPSV